MLKSSNHHDTDRERGPANLQRVSDILPRVLREIGYNDEQICAMLMPQDQTKAIANKGAKTEPREEVGATSHPEGDLCGRPRGNHKSGC
ncbi:MAG: hypothetical protein GWP08_14315 [Nitrospiraceae bacterium]|nr:hypothetical protein [Nitrospiraceae bacterium]